MKAEHRKELQTNTLADMLGRGVRNVRATSGVPWLRVGLVFLVLAGVGVFFWLKTNRARANAELWVDLDAGTFTLSSKGGTLNMLSSDEYKDTNQGKAARFQIAFQMVWEYGIKNVGANAQAARGGIAYGRKQYEELIKDCKGDPILEPEALYGYAAATEALACFRGEKDEDQSKLALDEAVKLYQELAKHSDYSKSAYGQLAARRAALLSEPAEFARILKFYNEFSVRSKF
jgi:hypothetical protein